MEAIIYSRFSSLEQRRGTSIERQQKAREYCRANGWAIHREIVDEGFSAWSNRHREAGQLGQLEREILNGDHEGRVVVIEHLDRLSRLDPETTLNLVQSFIRNGVSIVTTIDNETYHRNQSLPIMTIFKLLILSEQNHKASEDKSRRLREGYEIRREEARAEKRVMTSNAPPWLALDKKSRTFKIVQERAALVNEIFGWAEAGLGKMSIARRLNERGEPSWKKTRTGWHSSFIQRLLNNPAVLGEFQPTKTSDGKIVKAGSVIRDYYPAIVDPDLFARVTAGASDRKAVRGRNSQTLRNIVSGIPVCAHCGSTMNIRIRALAGTKRIIKGKEYTRTVDDSALVCGSYQRKAGCDNSTTIAYSTFERTLLNEILHLALDDRDFQSDADVKRLRSDVADLEREHGQAMESARELWLAFSRDKSKIMRMELAEQEEGRADALEARLKEARNALLRARGRVSEAEHLARVADVRSSMASDDLDIRYQARAKVAASLRAIITLIDCNRDGSVIVGISGGMVALKIEGGDVRRVEAVRSMVTATSLGVGERSFQDVFRRLGEIG